jgi:hypothetical protein
MNVIETRLSGRQATLDGVVHCLGRNMGTQPFGSCGAALLHRGASAAGTRSLRKWPFANCCRKTARSRWRCRCARTTAPWTTPPATMCCACFPAARPRGRAPCQCRCVAVGFMAWLARIFPMFFVPADAAEDAPCGACRPRGHEPQRRGGRAAPRHRTRVCLLTGPAACNRARRWTLRPQCRLCCSSCACRPCTRYLGPMIQAEAGQRAQVRAPEHRQSVAWPLDTEPDRELRVPAAHRGRRHQLRQRC